MSIYCELDIFPNTLLIFFLFKKFSKIGSISEFYPSRPYLRYIERKTDIGKCPLRPVSINYFFYMSLKQKMQYELFK